MIGRNVLILNKATVSKAIELYLNSERTLDAPSVHVVEFFKEAGQGFLRVTLEAKGPDAVPTEKGATG